MLGHGYDDAGRLTTSHWETGDGTSSTRSPLGGPSSFGFVYDAAENLSGRTVLEGCGTEEVVFTLGDRNRPTSVDGVVLEWDENGHLIRKGNRTYTYDYRGRLVTIDEEQNGQPEELVRYTYDAHNRRVRREVAGQEPVQTVWDGWQPVEEYRLDDDGAGGVIPHLVSRRIYGQGLDELVLLEREVGGALAPAIPFYDATGNLVQLVKPDGEVLERYE